jgi:DNA-binding Lrp family transcriptional regulator
MPPIDDLDMRLLRLAQNGIEITDRPFLPLGEKLGISEEEVIRRLEALIERKVVRRFSATIGHRACGIVANAMIVWRVPKDEIERVGHLMASFEEVTHCYERPTQPDWPYSLYTVIHSSSREKCLQMASEISTVTGINEYRILFSEREYKKTGAKL